MSEDLGNCQIGKLSHGTKKASLPTRFQIEVRGHGDVGTFPCGASEPATRGMRCIWVWGKRMSGNSPHPHVHHYTASGGAPPIIPTPYFRHKSSIFDRSPMGTTYTP